MKKLVFFLFILPAIAFSQKTISGTVNDDSGNPLPGVTIIVKGSEKTMGTTTDFDGNFDLSLPSDAKAIEVSYLGFVTQELAVSNLSSPLPITLQTDVSELDEVVIIGYGTVLKSDLTGSVASVKVEDNISRQSTTVDQLLQGRASGVQVIQNGANPGSGISVKIRGTNSLRGNNEPLYVIDGVIISSAGEDVAAAGGIGNSGQEAQSGLNGINPRDIESIEILKDASATAVYGSRGANGVVLITTKKGVKGKAKINVFGTTSIRSITKQYNVLDGVGYARYQNEIDINNGERPVFSIANNNVYPISFNPNDPNDEGVVSTAKANVYNWQDEVFQDSYSKNFGFSASGGSVNGNYYISAGFNDQKGLVKNSSFQSGDVRINLNKDLSSKIKLEARVSGFFSKSDFAESGDLIGANQSFIRNTLSYKPIVTDRVDEFFQELDTANPFSWIDDFADESDEKRYIASIGITFELPIDGLTFQIKAGGNVRTKDRRRFYGLTTFQGANANGALQISKLNSATYQINNFLRYNKTFSRKHRINATFGVTYDVRNVENSVYTVEDFVTTSLTTEQPFLGQVISTPLAFINSDQKLFSILGRFNYTFNNRYVLTASFRRDGVSKFAEGNRYGFFPAFALAWNMDKESFIKNASFISELKLRAGWGQIGNHGIGPYATLANYGSNTNALYGTPNNGTSVPIILNNIPNPGLTWETTEQLNFGFDFGFVKDRVTGSVDVYDKTTKDLLQNSPIPTSSGFSSLLINRGSISNKGVEVGLNAAVISSEDFELNIGGNIAFNKTRIESLGIPFKDLAVDGGLTQTSFYFGNNISRGNIFKSPANIFVEGEESALFYGFETNGIYQTEDPVFTQGAVPGDVKIVDQNEDGVIDIYDRTFIGNPNPDFVYGLNLSVQYKGLSLTALFNGVEGSQVANGNLLQMGNAEGNFPNILTEAYEQAWRPDAQTNTYPRIGYTTNGDIAITDRIIEDGSYLRLNNVTLGYDVPISSRILEKLNVYVSGQNLITWTDYSGFDPEITNFLYTGLINGVDWNGAPNARNILMGLNIIF